VASVSGLRKRARIATRAFSLGALTAISLPLYVARSALASREHARTLRNRWVSAWASQLLRVFNIDIGLHGTIPAEAALQGKGMLVVSNHRSAIDIGILLSTFGGVMVSRADLSTWPLIGPAARKTGTLFVDRSSSRSGASTIREIRKALESGDTVNVFPEGTTFAGDEVRPLHAGAFLAAMTLDVWILPVGIAYEEGSGAAYVNTSFTDHLKNVAETETIRARVSIGTPIRARDYAEAQKKSREIAEDLQTQIQALVNQARAEFAKRTD
jgi:lyso-ornithine lipid O-acyltransferase